MGELQAPPTFLPPAGVGAPALPFRGIHEPTQLLAKLHGSSKPACRLRSRSDSCWTRCLARSPAWLCRSLLPRCISLPALGTPSGAPCCSLKFTSVSRRLPGRHGCSEPNPLSEPASAPVPALSPGARLWAQTRSSSAAGCRMCLRAARFALTKALNNPLSCILLVTDPGWNKFLEIPLNIV